VVEGAFGVPYSTVALAACEALSQFDNENVRVILHTVNFVDIVPEMTLTLSSTFQREFVRQQTTELCHSDHPVHHNSPQSDTVASGEEIIAATVAADLPRASAEERMHVRMMICYCVCEI